jgi:hypothetical protein
MKLVYLNILRAGEGKQTQTHTHGNNVISAIRPVKTKTGKNLQKRHLQNDNTMI